MISAQRKSFTDYQFIMEETPANRIRGLMLEQDLTQQEVAAKIGKHYSLVSKYLSRTPVSNHFARNLQDAFGWSAKYILTGLGPKRINQSAVYLTPQQYEVESRTQSNVVERNLNAGRANLWVVPVSAQAGFINGFMERRFSHQIQRVSFPFIAGECFGFEVEGYSMFLHDDAAGSFPEGSYVICTINEDSAHLRAGTAYIFQTQDGIILKVFQGIADGKINLVSLNPEHNPVAPIAVEDLQIVYNIEMKLSRAKVNWSRTVSAA